MRPVHRTLSHRAYRALHITQAALGQTLLHRRLMGDLHLASGIHYQICCLRRQRDRIPFPSLSSLLGVQVSNLKPIGHRLILMHWTGIATIGQGWIILPLAHAWLPPYLISHPYVSPSTFPKFSYPKTTQEIPSHSTAATFPENRFIIPQLPYYAGSKKLSFKQVPTIDFSMGGRPGISLQDALRGNFTSLDGRDDLPPRGIGGTISCRIQVRFLCLSAASMKLTQSPVHRIPS